MISSSRVLRQRDTTIIVVSQAVSVLARESDYNRYDCYCVAGAVGHMATELVIDHYGIQGSAAARMVAYSEACKRPIMEAPCHR